MTRRVTDVAISSQFLKVEEVLVVPAQCLPNKFSEVPLLSVYRVTN